MLAATAWPPVAPAAPAAPVPRRLVRVRRVPPGLLPPGGADGDLVRPYVSAAEARQRAATQDARRRELEESVRRLNTWSSGGGGRR
ncbi:hypothetical protein EST92_26495 [Streptomyces sp. TM32]|uniref:hypothetical protein n=1 Tax=Streptomyces sp. TM32 TaxID=1652669 RepID=UPI001010ADD4|nr:hypothetical protein [Streptomyces sp. TM32]RXS68657.1 hypothetical protein EST92_26495 [Streptomyces sp. TM32]